MDKAELEDKLNDLIDYDGCYGIPAHKIPDAVTLMEMFAKEEMEQFWTWVHKNKSQDQRIRYSFKELFNEWKSKQK